MALDGIRTDEPFYFSTPGTTNDEGKIEIVSNNVEISNTYNGGYMLFKCNTTGGIPKTLMKLDPDLDNGAVQLCDSRIYIRTVGLNSYLDSLYGDSNFRNLMSSGIMRFRTRNASAVFKDSLLLNPDTETADFLAITESSVVINASSDAVNVRGIGIVYIDTSAGDVTIGGLANGAVNQPIEIIKTESANNLIIEHFEPTGTQKMILNAGIDVTLSVYGGMKLRYNGVNWYQVGY